MDKNLATLTGVVALTTVVVSMMKTWLANTPGVKHIPVFACAVIVAMSICFLSWGAGWLEGNIWHLLAGTVLTALGSSGLYSAVSGSSMQSLKVLSDKKLLTLPLLLLGLVGCGGSAEQQAYNARVGYNAALGTMVTLRDQGVITQAQVDATKQARHDADAALTTWEQLAKAKQDTTASEQAYIIASGAIQILLNHAKQPATKPTRSSYNGPSDHRDSFDGYLKYRPGNSEGQCGRSNYVDSAGMGRCSQRLRVA